MTIAAIILGLLLLGFACRRFLGFSSQKPSDYSGMTPEFSLKTQLNGPMICEGVIFGPFGKVTTSFVAKMDGTWEGNKGTLSEAFTYSNGRKQLRSWHLELGDGGKFTATADDVSGIAAGEASGSTAMLTYTIELPSEAGGHRLNVTDWMYLTDNGTIVNRSEMRKFGIKVAELVATMRPEI